MFVIIIMILWLVTFPFSFNEFNELLDEPSINTPTHKGER